VESITWVVFDSDLDIQFYKQVVTSDEKQVHISACRNFLAAIDMGMIPDGAQTTYKDLSNLYAGNGTSVELDKNQAALVVSYVAAQNYISDMEKQADAIKTQLCEIMKDAETALVNGQLKATWKSAKRTAFDSKKFEAEHPALAAKYKKQTTYRTFRVVEGE
jgi:predicted phage-related endonuclease